jgi:hypothetical protein
MSSDRSMLYGKKVDREIIDYILENFIYHSNGSITRNDRKNSNGSYDKDGYLIIKVKGKQFKAHRIAYLLNYRRFPIGEIDHINRDRKDNRIENLRVVSRKANIDNTIKKPNKNTGVVGVYIDNTNGLKKKFATNINGKTLRFMTLQEALNRKQESYNNER